MHYEKSRETVPSVLPLSSGIPIPHECGVEVIPFFFFHHFLVSWLVFRIFVFFILFFVHGKDNDDDKVENRSFSSTVTVRDLTQLGFNWLLAPTTHDVESSWKSCLFFVGREIISLFTLSHVLIYFLFKHWITSCL